MALDRIRQQPRRYTIPALAFALLAFAALIFGRSNETAQAISGGSPYVVPLIVDTNPNPNIVETTIVADEATVDVGGGVMAHALTFNGQLPGPEFRLKVGDTVIVHFQNNLGEVSGIHWHGIELANASDGTPLTQNQVEPGGSYLYKFIVSRPGIYWYHPHHHSSTNQVFKGLYGSIIVTDPYEAALIADGTLPSLSQTRTLALSDVTVCKAPGTNDAATYNPALPWVGGGPLPPQAGPTPLSLCETSPIDESGNPHPPFAAGDIPNIQTLATAGRTNEGQTVLTNGKNVGGRAGSPEAPGALAPGAETLNVQAGQGLRLRLGNTATIRFFLLKLTDNSGNQIDLVRVGGQGGLIDDARTEGSVFPPPPHTNYFTGQILIDPGDRADVVAAIPASATGTLTLWTQDFDRTGQGFSNVPTVPVAHFSVVGSTAPYSIGAGTDLRSKFGAAALVEALGPATGTLLNPAAFAPPKPGMSSQDVQLTATGSSLGINGVLGLHDFAGDYTAAPHPGSTRYAKLGDTLELTATNVTDAHHPFHLHGFSIQPISLTKSGSPSYIWPYKEFRDNIDIPKRYTLTYRVRLDDRTLMDGTTPGGGLGRWVFHCHIFFHATNGMISELDVVAPNGNERPYVNANGVGVTVNEGQTATMTGTSADPDGDAVTFSASVGTVTPTGGGNWSWSYPTTDGPDQSQFVAITATDAGGKKDQAIFQLTVNNLPPTINITSPADGTVFPINTPVTVTAAVSDPGTADVLTCTFNWGGGGPTTSVVAGGGTCSRTNTFTAAGFYTVTVTVSDGDGGSASDTVSLILFNPDSVAKGQGKINSPPGALVSHPQATGPANYAFNANYPQGKLIPVGKLAFGFGTADFFFDASSYDWLVGIGDRAQLKGTGRVGGSAPHYGFLVTVEDGTPDRFRIKIWDKNAGNAVVYDNVPGAPDDFNLANPAPVTQGTIVVHP